MIVKTILEQLYSGEIHPASLYTPKVKEYKEVTQRICDAHGDFTETLRKLDPPLDKRFIEILNEQVDAVSFEIEEMFIGGFTLGAKMMLEIFSRYS